jgi:phosphoglycolate phosphatase-like HAD superfamily hydrolase
MIKLVLLDFDDTICLSEESCFNFENEIAISMGLKPMDRTIHRITWGQNLKEAIKERIPGINAGEFMRRFDKMLPEAIKNGRMDAIPERNLAVLDKLKADGKKIAVVTSRSYIEVKPMISLDHPLGTRIDAFYHRDNSEHLKPDPRVFNKALYEFDVTPQETVYVGNALKDGFAAKGADLYFVAVLESELISKQDFANVNIEVDAYADKFTDTLDFILQH